MVVFFFLMIRRPPRSTLFPSRRSSDLETALRRGVFCIGGANHGAEEDCKATGGVKSPSRTAGRQQSLSVQTQYDRRRRRVLDRKSTRLNSSHLVISYAVFRLKRKSCYR